MRNKVKVRTLINIGGQDCKVIALDNNGIMLDFAMNDKCAVGTGRFLEVMRCIFDGGPAFNQGLKNNRVRAQSRATSPSDLQVHNCAWCGYYRL